MVEVVVSAALFVVSLGVLLVAFDTFTSVAERIGLSFGISPFVIAVTIVAGATAVVASAVFPICCSCTFSSS